MLNLIPALLLLLAGGPFGPSSSEALARIDVPAPKALVVQLARELERAGLTAAQAVLVMVSCEEQPAEFKEFSELPNFISAPPQTDVNPGFARNARTRDGPAL